MESFDADCLIKKQHSLAEGPHWHEGALWWVDIVDGILSRYDLETKNLETRAVGDMLPAVVPATGGRFLLLKKQSLAWLDWSTGKQTTLPINVPQLRKDQRFNDAKVDASNRVWAGTLNMESKEHTCELLRITLSGDVSSRVNSLGMANGMDWSPDGKRFYLVDSLGHCVWAFDWSEAEGTLANGEKLATFGVEEGVPDGMCVDAEGQLWVAFWGGYCVRRLSSRTGACTGMIEVPAAQVSACTFGGDDLQTLFITTAAEWLDKKQMAAEPLNGGIFSCRLPVKGQPTRILST